MYLKMNKLLLISTIIIVLLISGCAVIDEVKTGGDIITDFEDVNLFFENHMGENITAKGKAVSVLFLFTENLSEDTHFYRLKDDNGFSITFVPRGGRSINVGEVYTIKGTISKDRNALCSTVGNCEIIYYLKEVKP